MLRFMAALTVFMACLAVPGIAVADSGSITNVTDLGNGTVNATYTTVGDCAGDLDGYCFWYPHAVQGPASLPCYQYVSGDGRLTYVGGAPPPDYIWEGPATEVTTAYFYPTWSPVRLCLYINYSSNNRVLVAETVYPPTTATSPTPPPPTIPVSNPVPRMTVSEGKSYVPGVLSDEYGRKYNRRTLRRSCFRLTETRVRCAVSWRKGHFKYYGPVTMWNDPADPANSFLYRVNIKRKRTSSGSSSPGPSRNCDPNYSGCLDPNASDYDCAGGSGDGPRYTGRVVVRGNDHYGLDRDGDGIACDSASSASVSAASALIAERAAMTATRIGKGARNR